MVRTQVTTKIVSKHNIKKMLVPYWCKPVLVVSELECLCKHSSLFIIALPLTWYQVVLHDLVYLESK